MQDIGSQAISALRDDQVFVLSGLQLRQIITEALLEAQGSTISGQDELSSMKADILGLKTQINEHEKRLDRHTERIDDLDYGRDLQPKQKDRREILLALLAANGGKMFAKDARKKMGLGKATFSVLLKSLKDEIDKKPYHLNKSQLVISLAKL